MMTVQLMDRLRQCRTFDGAIETILNDTIALHGAEYGDLQLRRGDALLIVAQRNLPRDFLEIFRRVKPEEGSACARALRSGKTAVIEDVEQDSEYAPFLDAARKARYRSVQSTPLRTNDGVLVGVVSTLFVNPRIPTKIELSTLENYSTAAADYLLDLLDGRPIGVEARRMSDALYSVLI